MWIYCDGKIDLLALHIIQPEIGDNIKIRNKSLNEQLTFNWEEDSSDFGESPISHLMYIYTL